MPQPVPYGYLFRKGAPHLLVCGALASVLFLLTGQIGLVSVDAAGMVVVGVAIFFSRKEPALSHPALPEALPAVRANEAFPLIDELTQLASRHALHAKLETEWTRERRTAEATALVLIRVDAFEALRDGADKSAADAALFAVAGSLARVLPRRNDLLARYDSCTFGVVLPGTDLPGALRVAARLRWAIVRLNLAHPGTQTGMLTGTTGVAVQHGLVEESSTALISAAELVLAKACAQGGDALEYTVLQGFDREEPGGFVVPTMGSTRSWSPEQGTALQATRN